jgi:hypothetical protein
VCRRKLRRSHCLAWINDGITALNELGGRGLVADSSSSISLAQRQCLDSISDAYHKVGPPPDTAYPDGALSELLRSSRFYDVERRDIQPYTKGRMAWPDVGSTPIDLESNLPVADRHLVADWQHHLLASPAEAAASATAAGIVRPYLDPALVANPRVYGDFIRELSDRGLVGFCKGSSDSRGALGFFLRHQEEW